MARPVLAVHDELVLECPREDAEAVRAWLVGCMQAGMGEVLRQVPVAVEAVVCRDYAGTTSGAGGQ